MYISLILKQVAFPFIILSQVVSTTQTCSSLSALWMKREDVTWLKLMKQRLLGTQSLLARYQHSQVRLNTTTDCQTPPLRKDCNTKCVCVQGRTNTPQDQARQRVWERFNFHLLIFGAFATVELRMMVHGFLLCAFCYCGPLCFLFYLKGKTAESILSRKV